ncbi:hypothetical protein [Actinoplanes palleronii]|uniref:Uncharacterized protein n=1 Tax=Actinoplanes palleronii TaxID=113570 RepID=A0ABQ4BHG7_9ACTN|nr:hypothetical protein [Actinoplanes palleronii]GIE70097.1 hypothetical protein Apa02nite_062050 [Actinoplanes palleronii]
MKDDENSATDHPIVAAPDGRGLPDLGSVRAAAVFASGENALAYALRRLAADLGSDTNTPLLAGFGNFAPPDPEPI